MEERKYQIRSVQSAIDFATGRQERYGGVVVAPTGAGKSYMIAMIAEAFHKNNKKDLIILVVQPSVELLKQNVAKIKEFGINPSIYSGSLKSKDIGPVTYATEASLKDIKDFKGKVGMLIQDECHLSSRRETKFTSFVKGIGVTNPIGMTASPIYLASSYGSTKLEMIIDHYGGLYKKMIYCTQVKEMIALNYWSKLKYQVEPVDKTALSLNTTGVSFTDMSVDEFYEQNSMAEWIQEIIEDNPDRKSILIFVQTVDLANKLAECIDGAVAIHSKTKDKDREQFVEDFKNLKIRVAITVLALAVGFDHQRLDLLIDASPTNSFQLHYQKWGRAVRKHPDKKDALIVDLAGNFDRFGRLEDISFEEYLNKWYVFSGNRLLSGVSLNYDESVTRKQLMKKIRKEEAIIESRKVRYVNKLPPPEEDPKKRIRVDPTKFSNPSKKTELERLKTMSDNLGKLKFGKFNGKELYDICYHKSGQPIQKNISYFNWMYRKWDFENCDARFRKKNMELKRTIEALLRYEKVIEI